MSFRNSILVFLFFSIVLLGAFAAGKKEAAMPEDWSGKTLQIIGHRVHQAAASGEEGEGENLIQAFKDKYKVDIVYQTYDSPRVNEKFYQLGPLTNTEEDIIHINQNMQIKTKLKSFLEPLDSYIAKKPIEGFPEKFGALLEAVTVEGKVYAIPIRAGNWALWYNKKILDERGVAGPPKTAEDLYDLAKKLTYESKDGAKIFGWSMRGDLGHAGQMLCMFARMWDGDIISPDFKVLINKQPVVNAANLMRKMYVEGIMPPDWHTYGYAQSVKIFLEGRASMILEASNYWSTFNDPAKSKVAGNAFPAPLPLAKQFVTAKRDFSVGSVWFWSMGILKGSQDKDLAYEYVRHLASRESHLNMALSGNSPPRIDVLSDPKYLKLNPGAVIDAMVAPYTRTWIPAFENMIEVSDICGEVVHRIVVEGNPAQQELDAVAQKIKDLLP